MDKTMTNLEQLARIINQHQLKGVGGGTMLVSWAICTCEHTERTHGDRDYAQQLLAHHQAQAIHDAGWTGPVPEFQRKINQAIVNRAAAELGSIPHRFVIGVDQQTTPSYLDN